MKTLIFVILLGAFAACGNNSGTEEHSDTATVAHDTAFNGTINPGSTGVGGMNVDTTGMGEAR